MRQIYKYLAIVVGIISSLNVIRLLIYFAYVAHNNWSNLQLDPFVMPDGPQILPNWPPILVEGLLSLAVARFCFNYIEKNC